VGVWRDCGKDGAAVELVAHNTGDPISEVTGRRGDREDGTWNVGEVTGRRGTPKR